METIISRKVALMLLIMTSHHIMMTHHHVIFCLRFRKYYSCMQGVLNVLSPCLCPFPEQGIETKHEIQCRIRSLFLYIIFPQSPRLIQCSQNNHFFKGVAVAFFRLFLKPFSHRSLNFIITCKMSSFEMFLKSC